MAAPIFWGLYPSHLPTDLEEIWQEVYKIKNLIQVQNGLSCFSSSKMAASEIKKNIYNIFPIIYTSETNAVATRDTLSFFVENILGAMLE